ncbi:kelch repeat-containing protein [Sorangium sp. So ce1128]
MRSMWRLGSAIFCGLAMLRAGTAWAASAPSWESVPSMITPRGEHTATELQDGRVLVAGGFPVVDASPYTSLAAMSLREVEIYDPATRTWAPAAPLAARPTRASPSCPSATRATSACGCRRPSSTPCWTVPTRCELARPDPGVTDRPLQS